MEHPSAFDDTVAYGGWQIDNHLPGGFFMNAQDGGHLQKRRLSEPYSIPYRCLYSVNVDNLMFAGRNISCTHIGISTTRVMGTVAVLGQAAGTGAAVAAAHGVSPRQAGRDYIREIQAALMEDDCFLPHFRREISPLAKAARLSCDYGDCSNLINGIDRRIWGMDNGYFGKTNMAVTYTFQKPEQIAGFRLVADSDLDREFVEGNPDGLNTSSVLFYPASHNNTTFGFPGCLLKSFRVEALGEDGTWRTVYETDSNRQRLIRRRIDQTALAVRLIPLSTYQSEKKQEDYGSSSVHLFAFEVF